MDKEELFKSNYQKDKAFKTEEEEYRESICNTEYTKENGKAKETVSHKST